MKTDAIDNYVYDLVDLMLHILLVCNYNVCCKLKTPRLYFLMNIQSLQNVSNSLSAITRKMMMLLSPLIIFRHRLIVFR